MSIASAVVKTLLGTNWTKANTDNRVPIVINTHNDADPNLAMRFDSSNNPVILVYELSENRVINGIGINRIWKEDTVTIDIIDSSTQAKAIRVRDECYRVLEAAYASPGTGYQYIKTPFSVSNHSGTRDFKRWRWTIDVTLVRTNVAAGG